MTTPHTNKPATNDTEEEAVTYVCDNCGREVDEAEVYTDEGVLCPDCFLDSVDVSEE